MRITFICTALLAAAALAGCGGDESTSSEPLRDGVYEYELSEQYLLDNEIGPQQAKNESGHHEVTLDEGEFVDRWRGSTGTTGSCSGTYEADGNRVTFRWTTGCFGDWAMSYDVDGERVSWSDIEALAPYADEEEQHVAEVFNGVAWEWARAA